MTSSPTIDLGKHALQAHFWTTICASASDFWTLTKPEVNFLIVIATFTGFYLGCPTNLDSVSPGAAVSHIIRNTAGGKRHRRPEPVP